MGNAKSRMTNLAIALSLIAWPALSTGTRAQENCDYIMRDCNHNGIPGELGDLIAMISYYRGTIIPWYTCNCPPHDSLFMPDADQDGNCVPFELSDVLMMIAHPTWPPLGCADCPGYNLSPPDSAGKVRIAPGLKSRVRNR